jgi:transaldolase
MSHPILKATLDLGQSVWLDFISRKLLRSGQLTRLIEDGVRGMTSNPTIFEQAVTKSSDYDDVIREGQQRRENAAQVFERLAVKDIAEACDALREVYDDAQGTDGFVSIEVSPKLAHDANETIAEAKRLWSRVNRPNLMVKVPGTDEGMPAVRRLLADGLNINITLLFSLRQYRAVIDTYVAALEERAEKKQDLSRIASVASFFVSRVDSSADKQLTEKGHAELAGKAAIANACLAYRHFLSVTASERWKRLQALGAHVQRPLWASTSTKNPAYSDVLYMHELVAKDTVNTLPMATLEAWKDHGTPSLRLVENLKTADDTLRKIQVAGVNVEQITEDLIEDGVVKFAASFDTLLAAIDAKLKG